MEVHVIYLLIVVVPKEWTFSKAEEEFLQQLQIDNCERVLKNAPLPKANARNGLSKKNTELRLVMLQSFNSSEKFCNSY